VILCVVDIVEEVLAEISFGPNIYEIYG
jgi:hypothetical protein